MLEEQVNLQMQMLQLNTRLRQEIQFYLLEQLLLTRLIYGHQVLQQLLQQVDQMLDLEDKFQQMKMQTMHGHGLMELQTY